MPPYRKYTIVVMDWQHATLDRAGIRQYVQVERNGTMNTVLGIETTTERLSAALITRTAIHERHADVRSAHCELLPGFISELVGAEGLDVQDIDLVTVSIGPGSFTGLRIGIAAAMGLAHGLGIGTVGVSTLAALAWNAEATGLICPIIDARRNEVYTALYSIDGPEDSPPAVIHEPSALPIAALVEILTDLGEPVTLTGPAAHVFGDRITDAAAVPVTAVPLPHALSSAVAVAELGAVIASIDGTVPPAALTPSYLRRSDAEIARPRCT